MRPFLLSLFAAVLVLGSGLWLITSQAEADAGAEALAAIDAGPEAPSVAVVEPVPAAPCIDADGPGPAPCVASPLDEPRAYLDTAATAKRDGWALLVVVLAFGILTGVSRWVAWLRSGWRALAVSTGIATTAAAANAGFLGGSWTAMLTAAGAALMLAWQGDRTVAAQVKAAKAVG